MKVLIKLGGTLLDKPESLRALAKQLAEVSARCRLTVVHGGGRQVTRFLEERGISSRFQNGLRVSDAAVMDAVTKVIAGSVNKQLVAAVIAAGKAAVGLSGVDGSLTDAVPLDPGLGFVGKPVKTDGRLLDLLTEANYLPVVACVAGDADGHLYNVNADAMAVSCAVGWGASQLFFLTDVEGVKDGNGAVLRQLPHDGIRGLIASGAAHGGMQAKLEAAERALQSGISVSVASGAEPHVCARLLDGEPIGTRLLSETHQAGVPFA